MRPEAEFLADCLEPKPIQVRVKCFLCRHHKFKMGLMKLLSALGLTIAGAILSSDDHAYLKHFLSSRTKGV